MKITNNSGFRLPIAVWLLHDNYDYINDENYISATSLLRPIKQIILAKRVLAEDKAMDLAERVSASMGNALHDSIQSAWENPEGRAKALRQLGYPDQVIDRVVVNPSKEHIEANPDCIPVWIEHRMFRKINGFIIGGKLDFSAEGMLDDFKSTSVYTYLKNRKDTDYQLQGSIYRWLDPELIKDEFIHINFIFTDWQKFMSYNDPDYPKDRIKEHVVKLLSLDQTEKFISDKLNQIVTYWNSPEEEIPECTDEDLWRSDPQYKYYSDPQKANDPKARSSKNFDNLNEANAHMAEKGKGIIKVVPGEVKACQYCPAYLVCKQKDQYNV